MRILFITATRVGDAVLSTGLLSYLSGRFPDATFTIAAGAVAAPLFEAVPGLEKLISIKKQRYGLHWWHLWRECAGTRWDMVIDLRRSAIGWFLRAQERHVTPKATSDHHRVELLASTLGLEETPPAPHIWLLPRHETRAAEIIPEPGRVLALAPAANWAGKQWRPERFADLAERLTGNGGLLAGAPIAVFAAAEERAAIEPLLDQLPADRLIDTVGDIDLPTIAACLKRCTLFVGNDSGLMHIAAASGIMTLGLFGPSREEHYAPWGPRSGWVRTKESYDTLVGAEDFDHRTTGTLMDGLSVGRAEEAARALWTRIEGTQT
ncbi:MAG: glycosyltransferase family 9 protein [Pseudomonadota bacterium]